MKPPKRDNIEYEKVKTDDFVTGQVEDIQYEEEHIFKWKEKGVQKEKKGFAVRLKFLVDEYEHPHYSRWMSFSYGEKSNLYIKYLAPLIENAQPDMDFDLDLLKGFRVKMLWAEKNGFQSIETIRPLGEKLKPAEEPADASQENPSDEVPF